jgi:Holliday junction resolvasome RuvABC endonuclease subunit
MGRIIYPPIGDNMPIVMGLDLSLTGTGVVAVDNNWRIVEKRLITSSPKEENTPRLAKIALSIHLCVGKILPDLVIIEGPAFGIGKTTSMFQLGELAGIVKRDLFIANYPFIIVPPTVLKKFVTGKGNAKKDLMLLAIHKKFGEDFEDDNLADAYALARYGFQFLNPVIKRRSKI